MTTATRIETIAPITRPEAHELASAEYARFIDQIRSLAPDEWTTETDCPPWDVRAMAGHCVGMMSDFTSYSSLMRRMRAATKAAKNARGPLIDAMTAQQVADNAGLSTDELIARAEHNRPRVARWRATRPRLFRRMPMKQEVAGRTETWRMGYLLDTILTRDPWMHRIDIARATGHKPVLTPEHDGRIIADVVAEWATRHARPVTLTLTGSAGGEYVAGAEPGEQITIDAVEFCRVISGRAPSEGLLAQEVPF
jgi:uncharacterized protein (TIGR03083 family)